MLDQLIKLVEQNADSAIIKNDAIPNEKNNEAIATVAKSIFSGLQNQAAQGNLTQLAGMFQGGKSNLTGNPIVAQLISSVAGSVASKLGISQQAAQTMASSLLPTVMNQLVSKTNDPKDNSFDLTDIMKSVSGNNNLDVSSILSSLAGGSGSKLSNLGSVLNGMFGKK